MVARLTFAGVVVVLSFAAGAATAASAGPPPGFYEAKVLEPAASYVAGKPATIYCANSWADWNTYAERNGVADAEGGFTYVGAGPEYLAPVVCQALRLRLRGKAPKLFDLAAGMLILTHESVHVSGIRDEGKTECRALALLPAVAHRFFGYAYHRAPLRALMAQAWKSHREKPAAYTVDCP